MPSDKSVKESSSKDKDKSEKDKRGSSGKDGKGGKSKDAKAEAKLSVAEIKAEEYKEFVTACIISHSGWLSTPLLNLSSALSLSPLYLSLSLLSFLLLILLLAPPSWIPHISAPITLLIPLQNSLDSIAHLKRTKKGGGSGAEVQWIVFWIGWVLAGWVGEMIRTFRPGWKGVWEIARVGVGIVLGGPWFSKEAMIPGKPSPRLAEAEKREAAEQAKAEKQAKEAEKRKAGKEGKEEGQARDEAKEKAKAKARAKEKAEKAKAKAE